MGNNVAADQKRAQRFTKQQFDTQEASAKVGEADCSTFLL